MGAHRLHAAEGVKLNLLSGTGTASQRSCAAGTAGSWGPGHVKPDKQEFQKDQLSSTGFTSSISPLTFRVLKHRSEFI